MSSSSHNMVNELISLVFTSGCVDSLLCTSCVFPHRCTLHVIRFSCSGEEAKLYFVEEQLKASWIITNLFFFYCVGVKDLRSLRKWRQDLK